METKMGLKNLTIGKKIAVGFAVVLILFAGVVGTSVMNANRVGTAMDLSDQAMALVQSVMQAREAEKDYIIYDRDQYATRVEQHLTQAMGVLTGIRGQSTDTSLAAEMHRAEELLRHFQSAFKQFLNNNSKMKAEQAKMDQAAKTVLATISDKIRSEVERRQSMTFITGVALNPAYTELANMAGLLAFGLMEARMNETAFIYGNDDIFAAAFHKNFQYCIERQAELANLARIVRDEEMQQAADLIEQNLVVYGASFGTMLAVWRENVEVNARMTTDGVAVVQIAQNMASHYNSNLIASKDLLISLSLILLIAGLIVGIGCAWLIIRTINNALGSIVNQLTDGAEEVTAAAGEISSASHSLAEGASQQAASIEETSSSLEEMSSMTRQNADNARQADGIMAETSQDVQTAGSSMRQLTDSMQEITRASEETSKIVKTIDEIAFQTNLLALNAAVEAARAGEAGAGFAVVADEVRNLALRAGEAARNTAELIEGTVKKVGEGARLVSNTNAAFEKVARSATKISSLVAEIAAASSEQAQGIEQVNTAVVEMDKVTQQTAANAQESASSSEEMHAQAEYMKAMVVDLARLIGRHSQSVPASAALEHSASPQQGRMVKPQVSHKPAKTKAAISQKSDRAKKITPRELIPFDEDELKNF